MPSLLSPHASMQMSSRQRKQGRLGLTVESASLWPIWPAAGEAPCEASGSRLQVSQGRVAGAAAV